MDISNFSYDDLFSSLEKSGKKIDEKQKEQIKNRLDNILQYEPRIGIFGKTGVGKSSLCNALFGQDICEISDVEACTRNTKDVLLNLGAGKGIKLIDVPGVGESSERDKEYSELYANLLPELDLVLWLIKADDRAMASDEAFYKHIVKPHIEQGKPFFFVLNQVDKIEPFREWDEEKHEPGPKQFQNIYRKKDDLSTFFDIQSSKIIPISANEKYNLTVLVDEFIRALPPEKKITTYASVNDEFRSEATGEHVKETFLNKLGDIIIDVIDGISNAVSGALNYIADKISRCYITTAVCKKNGKDDNCYELTKFREFRDNWLIHQEDGEYLIKRYYEIAPKIVDAINLQNNSDLIYDEINEKYLMHCLEMIEKNQYEECKKLYVEMVEKLEKEYLQNK
ncbi:GTPase family protein [Brachyspira intermedia]|uniref:GTPase family protein n=1 Tax=Brachyspira intermedia TaxID=84377 RepID=UPI003004EE1A